MTSNAGILSSGPSGGVTLSIDGVGGVPPRFLSALSALSASSFGFKLVILDESDSMTKDAQFALRRIIERYTKYTRFCLICNFPSKIIPALQSRCTKFRLSALKFEDIKNTIQHVSSQEDLNVTEKGLVAVCTVGCGDIRKSLNILQSAHLASLARKNPINLQFAERVELYVNSMEIANGFAELTDPIEQRRRFEQDLKNRKSEGRETVPLDNKLLKSIELGLPECSGCLLYTSPSPRDRTRSRMPSSA